jgi:septal ring factor EnvC (AmiA/AmiB activator)
MQPRVVRLAAGLVVLLCAFTAPVSAAARETIEAQIDALRQLVERQQTQLEAQQHQLETQRAELDVLKSQATVPAPPPAVPSDSQRIEDWNTRQHNRNWRCRKHRSCA